MAYATLPPPRPPLEIRQEYELAGSSAQELLRNFKMAVSQWNDRPSLLIEQPSDESIQRVPFKKAGTIRVRFKPARPMKPRNIEAESSLADD